MNCRNLIILVREMHTNKKTALACRMLQSGCSSVSLGRTLKCQGCSMQTLRCCSCTCRLWGWTSGENCAFKDAYGLPVYYPEYFTAPSHASKASGNAVKPIIPSAAPPATTPSTSAPVFEAAVSDRRHNMPTCPSHKQVPALSVRHCSALCCYSCTASFC
jgi:hypothetical protein